MIELQQILNDIAQKGSDSPFEGPKSIRFRKPYRSKRKRPVASEHSDVVQLSLFQNR